MKNKIITVGISMMLLFPSLSYSADAKFESELTSFVEKTLKEHEVKGFSLAVVSSDKVLYKKTFGVKNIYTKEAVTSKSLFHLASVTKTFVGLSLMQLHEKGKIDLDAPVVDVVPYFVLVDKRYKNLTIRQFASHISGMPDFDSDPWHHKEYDDKALERFVRDFISHKFLNHEPSSKYQYCNTGYELLGDVIAKASGLTFEEYVAKNILKPLGMKESTLLIREADFTKLNSLHYKVDGKTRIHDIYPYNRAHGPSSTMISNLDDMTKYLQMYLRNGKTANGAQIIKASSIAEMFKPALGKFDNIGVSWHRKKQNNIQTFYHGGNDGFKAYVVLVPEKNIGLVYLSNTADTPYHHFVQGMTDIILKQK